MHSAQVSPAELCDRRSETGTAPEDGHTLQVDVNWAAAPRAESRL